MLVVLFDLFDVLVMCVVLFSCLCLNLFVVCLAGSGRGESQACAALGQADNII